VLDVELVTVNTAEGAAYGAALLAATGAGVFPDVESASASAIQVTGCSSPGPATAAYREIYTLYHSLYLALQPTFHAISHAESSEH